VTHAIKQAIFDVSRSLEIPVLILALLALAAVIVELGAFAMELRARHRRHFPTLIVAAKAARAAIDKGDRAQASTEVAKVAWSAAMADTLETIAQNAGTPGADTRLAKALADFDFDAQRKLGRTRLLVRVGPALGLMGTLIPLSPALSGLAKGNVNQLSDNLRVAFSVTVLGLLIGAVAFGLSLYRDRIYGQDLSDLEYVAAVLTDDSPVPADPAPPPAARTPATPPVGDPPPKPADVPAAEAPPTDGPAAQPPRTEPPAATPDEPHAGTPSEPSAPEPIASSHVSQAAAGVGWPGVAPAADSGAGS
jgi:biopolymer transport protein ExbB/TolQ